MQIVIDIDEYLKDLCEHRAITRTSDYVSLERAIANGKALPKGHGRLGDLDKLKEILIDHRYSNDFCISHHIDNSISMGVINSVLVDAPTVIEADREVDNG